MLSSGQMALARPTTVLALAAAAILIAGCGPDCTPSADIQVTVVPTEAVNAHAIARLRVTLSVDGAPARTLEITPQGSFESPRAFILRPDPAPRGRYGIALTVEALDAAGALVGIGSAGGEVLAEGCNRLEARLTPLNVGGMADGGVFDFSPAPDSGPQPDLAPCEGSRPDEDQDNRGDVCDLCPADSDPTPADADGDDVPDACDPDPTKAGNTVLYFEGFNLDSGQWSGDFPVTSGFLNIVTNPPGPRVASNGATMLPTGVRVQTTVYMPYFIGGQSVSDSGIYLGQPANPGAASSAGMVCSVNFNQGSQQGELVLSTVQGGMVTGASRTPFPFMTGVRFRIRLTQRGAAYLCEAASAGQPTVSVTRMASAAPVGPQFMALHAQNVEAHFHSVVAQTALP